MIMSKEFKQLLTVGSLPRLMKAGNFMEFIL